MKIAIITSGFLPVVDGVTITGYARVQQLSKKGHQVLLFCPDYSKIAHIYPDWQQYTGEILPGVRVVNLPSTAFFVEFERNVAWYGHGKLQQELAAFQPDIIHVDEPERLFVGLWRIPGLKYARQHNIPCIGFFRTNFIEYLEDFFPLPKPILFSLQWLVKRLVLYVYNAYDLTLVTSKITAVKIKKLGIKNTYYDNFLGIKVKQYNSLQPQADFFARKYELPELDNIIKLIFLGRLTPEKGWNFTLKHLEQILQHIDKNKVAFLIVGDGELKAKIAEKMRVLTPYFHLFGRVAPDDVPALLINSDIHVTTSEKETRGLTVLEAFTAGIPVLAPRSEGIVENIESGNNGFLYNPGDITDFIDKLQTLIEDNNLRRQMGERGRVSVNNKYTWDVAIDNLLEVWQKQIETYNS
jgi:glycosyltransferase involved in cell wall biosynthesis